jgi:hypothetical protein
MRGSIAEAQGVWISVGGIKLKRRNQTNGDTAENRRGIIFKVIG